jgi:FUN14 domain-containing protein 1
MARPIPDINLREISKDNEAAVKPTISISYLDAVSKLTSKKSSGNFVAGTLTGWLAGVAVIRVGKIAAFGLGGGVILLHFASECGYINVNWDRVRESAGESHAWMEKLVKFVKRHSCFSVGFVGGFFFGVAST